MSAPLSGSSGGNPTPGYYPDPSIPGYIRYWNGSSWVSGTSRPEPKEGEEVPAPPSAEASSAAVAPPTPQEPAPAEETGPVFLDPRQRAELEASRGGDSPLPEVRRGGAVEASAASPSASGSDTRSSAIDWDDPSRLHGQAPRTGGGWGAHSAQQPGVPGQREGVSWGRDASKGPQSGTGGGSPEPDASASKDELAASAGSAETPATDVPQRDGTVQMRAVNPGAKPQPAKPANTEPTVGLRRSDILKSGADGGTSEPKPAQPANTEPTVGLRRSDILKQGGKGQGGQGASVQPDKTVGLRREDILKSGQNSAPSAPPAEQPPTPLPGAAAQQPPQQPQQPQQPQPQQPGGYGYPPQQPQQGGYGYPPQQSPQQPGGYGYPPQQPSVPHQQGAPQQQGHQPWSQQVNDLAQSGAPGQEQVTPWRPPAADPFAQAVQEARPASLGKRFGARVVDGLITSVVSAGIAFPFVGSAVEHIQSEIDAAMAAGETRTVWLIDGTTAVPFGIVLAGLIVFGLLYEVLPTARWGRTLGKRLFGLHVLTMESQEKPGFGAALKRWLTYGVLSVLVIGIVNVLWCLFDRPWRQCWHDKLANTFVAKDSGEIRL